MRKDSFTFDKDTAGELFVLNQETREKTNQMWISFTKRECMVQEVFCALWKLKLFIEKQLQM